MTTKARSLTIVIFLSSAVLSCGKTGQSTEYYENGSVKSIKEFKNGKLDGKYVSFYSTGVKRSEEEYRNGRLFGSIILYDEKGDTTELVRFLEHGKDGEQKLYFPGSKLKMTLGWVHDHRQGAERHYLESGQLTVYGNYERGVKDSIWTFYDSTGQMFKKEYWRMGSLDSIVVRAF